MADKNLTLTKDFVNEHIEMSNDIQDTLEKLMKFILLLQKQICIGHKKITEPHVELLVKQKHHIIGIEEMEKNIEEDVNRLHHEVESLIDGIEKHKEKFIEFSSKAE